MKASLVKVTILMPLEPGAAGHVSGILASHLKALDFVTSGPAEIVEVDDMRGFECDWDDWNIRQ